MKKPTILIVPGRGDSAAGHWQSILELTLAGALRVRQDDWNTPSLAAWSKAIDRAVRALDHRPLLVAHSFGCLAAAHAEIALGTPVGATLFVAPADPERFGLSPQAFERKLEGPGILVASNNDPWMPIASARKIAADWGVRFLDMGASGHINIASGHGPWPLGEELITAMRDDLEEAQASLPRRSRARRSPRQSSLAQP